MRVAALSSGETVTKMVGDLETLASYLPGFVIDRINNHSHRIVEPRSEDFPAVVFFADISGFTKLSEQLAQQPDGADVLTDLLNRYFGLLIDAVVLRHNGDVVKFAGDALLAIWRTSNEDLAETTLNAVHCALEVQNELKQLPDDGYSLSVKINIASGELRILELGGVFGRWDWTICGRPLVEIGTNPTAGPGELVVAKPTWNLIKDACRGKKHRKNTIRILSQNDFVPTPPRNDFFVRPDAHETLRSYLPVAVLSRIHAGTGKLSAELRRVTVLFVNLPGLTHETTLDDAQQTAASLQRAIYQFEGSVNKFSVDEKGTTLVAAFGLPPLTHPDDPVRGVRAAVAIQDAFEELDLAHSIGICTGRVFCGSVGNSTRREYTVLGDVVNLTARLMQAAKDVGGVLCDEETWSFAQHEMEFDALPPINVKGKQEPIPIFIPRQRKHVERSFTQRLVGRTDVREQLDTIVSKFVTTSGERESETVVLTGEAGIGKTHLVHGAVGGREDIRLLAGHADSGEKATAYHVWRGVFRQLFAFDQVDQDEQSRTEHVRRLLSSDVWLRDRVPLLNAVVSIAAAETPLTEQLTGDVRADNTRELMLRLLERESRESPMVIVLEDLHWFDSASWAVLNGVRRRRLPLVLILITRPKNENRATDHEFATLLDDDAAVRVRLDELSRTDTDILICDCLDADRTTREVSEWIYARSKGHPYFTRELTLALADSNAICVERGVIRPTEEFKSTSEQKIPETLDGVINSRLDQVPSEQCMVLKSASVIGADFAVDLLTDIHPIPSDKPNVPSFLQSLGARDLTRRVQSAPEVIWEFQHAITREVAYQLLLFSQRQQLHLAIANWYERQHRDSEANLPRLANHWAAAGNQEKACDYFARAGSFSLANGAHREARQLLQKAFERLHTPGRGDEKLRATAATIKRQLGEACMGLGHLQESVEHLREALRWLGHPEPKTLPGRAASVGWILSWQAARRIGITGQSRHEINKYLEAARICGLMCELYYLGNESLRFFHASLHMHMLAQKAGPSRELALANAINCLTAGTIPMRPLARTYLQRARDEEESLSDAQASARILLMAGIHHVGHGEWEDARDALASALAKCEGIDDYRNHGTLSVVYGATWYFSGDATTGLEIWNRLHAKALDRGDVLHEAWGDGGIALNCLRLGDLEKAVEHAESALSMFEKNKDLISQITTSGVLTLAFTRLRRHVEAADAMQSTRRLLKKLVLPTSYYLLDGYAAVAEQCLETSRLAVETNAPATHAFKSVRKALRGLKAYARLFPIGKTRFQLISGELAALQNRPVVARFHFQQSLRDARHYKMDYDAARALHQLGVHTAGDESQKHLHEARTIFHRLAAKHDLQLVEAAVSRIDDVFHQQPGTT